MSFNQHELGKRFERGETTGTASNVKIKERSDGSTELVGYGWAVYARRTADGHIMYFKGWYGYSPSTSQQLTRMGLEAAADEVVDDDPTTGARPRRTRTR